MPLENTATVVLEHSATLVAVACGCPAFIGGDITERTEPWKYTTNKRIGLSAWLMPM